MMVANTSQNFTSTIIKIMNIMFIGCIILCNIWALLGNNVLYQVVMISGLAAPAWSYGNLMRHTTTQQKLGNGENL
jgi:hypothetical protein